MTPAAHLQPAHFTPVGRAWVLGIELTLTGLELERVWAAVDGPEALTAWFPCHVSGSFVPGGELTFRFEAADRADDLVLPGAVMSREEPQRWVLDWAGDLLTLVLDAAGDPATPVVQLRFGARLAERGRGARDAAGWHVCLARLAAALGAPLPPSDADWPALFSRYAQSLGPEAATQGPPGA